MQMLWPFLVPILVSIGGLVLFVVGFVLWALWQSRGYPSDSEKAAGTYADHFVYIEEDGGARELSAKEKEYLNTDFHPNDGARPYIKESYRQRTPDGRMRGFLLRRRLPKRIAKAGIRPAPDRG